MSKRPHLIDSGVLFVYTLISIVMVWPAVANLRGNYGLIGAVDVYMFMWGFWWMHYSLGVLHTWPFHTTMLYHPFGTGLSFHTDTPLITLLFSPITGAYGPEFSYNLDVIISFIFSAFSMYLLVNYLVGDKRAAFLGGAVFAFSTFKAVQTIGHLHITNTEFFPIYVLFFIKMLREPKHQLRHAIFAGLSLGFVFLIDYYQTVYLIFFSVCYLIYYLFNYRNDPSIVLGAVARPFQNTITWLHERYFADRSTLFALLRRLLVLGLVFIVIGSPLLIAIYSDIKAGYYVKWGGEDIFYADIAGFFVPVTPLLSKIPGVAQANVPIIHAGGTESLVYAGWVVLLLVAFGTMRLARRLSEFRFWLVFIIICFLFALGLQPHFLGYTLPIPGPYALWAQIPFLNNARIPSRFDLLVTFAAGILVGYSVKELLALLINRLPSFRPALLSAILLVLITPLMLAEHYVLPPLLPGEELKEPRDTFAQIAAEPGDFAVLDLPLDGPATPHYGLEHIMYEQTMHHKNAVGGSISRPLTDFYAYYGGDEYIDLLNYALPKTPHLADVRVVLSNTKAMNFYRHDAANLIYYLDIHYLIVRPTVLPTNALSFIQQTLPVDQVYPPAGEPVSDTVIYRVDPQAVASLAVTDTVDIGSNLGNVFRLRGWGAPQPGSTEGFHFAWAQQVESEVLTSVRKPDNYTVTLKLRPLIVNNQPQTLTIYLNDETNPAAIIPMSNPEWQEQSVGISREHWREGINTMRLRMTYAAKPGNGDPRTLSLAINTIRFTPNK